MSSFWTVLAKESVFYALAYPLSLALPVSNTGAR